MNENHVLGAGQMTPRFWLQRIHLANFRCFNDLSIDFDRHLTVLIARNGQGKTAILDAITILVGTFVGSFYTGRGKGIATSDVTLWITNQNPLSMAPQYSTVLSGEGDICGQMIQWSRSLNSPKSKTTVKDARNLTSIARKMQSEVTDNKVNILPVMAYYGTGRLWSHKKKTERKLFESGFYDRTAGYQDCLDSESSYKYFEDWFRYASKTLAESEYRKKESRVMDVSVGKSSYSGMIDAVRHAVDVCLRVINWSCIRYSFMHQALVMEHPQQGVLEVGQLSDGVRNMIGMVADIAYRMVQLNSHLGADATLLTPGLVLIDEVDMHLHPEWQQTVLCSLSDAFPNVQFVVTTHSPQVVSSVDKDKVRIISQNIDDEFVVFNPVVQTYGRSNADVLQTAMGVSPEVHTRQTDDLRRYLSLVEQGQGEGGDAQKLRGELNAVFGPDHPLLIKADMASRRRRALER